MVAGHLLAAKFFVRSLRRARRRSLVSPGFRDRLAAPAAAVPPPTAALDSTDAILKWINAYRGKPEPDALPVSSAR